MIETNAMLMNECMYADTVLTDLQDPVFLVERCNVNRLNANVFRLIIISFPSVSN